MQLGTPEIISKSQKRETTANSFCLFSQNSCNVEHLGKFFRKIAKIQSSTLLNKNELIRRQFLLLFAAILGLAIAQSSQKQRFCYLSYIVTQHQLLKNVKIKQTNKSYKLVLFLYIFFKKYLFDWAAMCFLRLFVYFKRITPLCTLNYILNFQCFDIQLETLEQQEFKLL